MKHIETKKKVQQRPNKSELSGVHYIRQAYNLPCGTCVYSEYCKKAGINKANFRVRIIDNEYELYGILLCSTKRC